MLLWQVIMLGLVQGLTEFLPVSSSGHLVLTQALFGVAPGLAFDVLLHVATLVAVVVAYRNEVLKLIQAAASLIWPGAWRGSSAERRQALSLLLALLVGSVPAGLAGILLEEKVAAFFASPRTIGLYLWATALILLAAELVARSRPIDRNLETPTFGQSLFVGMAQAVALFPGVSRSGITVTAGLLAGLSREGAAKFSFLLSIPVIAGAGLLQLPDLVAAASSESSMLLSYLVGGLVAALSGYLAIRIFIQLIARARFAAFSLYLLVAGALTLLFLK